MTGVARITAWSPLRGPGRSSVHVAPIPAEYLRISGLREDRADGVIMACEDVGLHFGAHVPYSAHTVPPASHQQV